MMEPDQLTLCFHAKSSFRPEVTLRLLPPEPGGQDAAYRLACEVKGFVMDQGAWEVPVQVGAAERLLADLEALDLDPAVARATGVDGTTISLDFGPLGRERRLTWWTFLPEQWDGVAPILLHLMVLAGPRAERHVDILGCLEDPEDRLS